MIDLSPHLASLNASHMAGIGPREDFFQGVSPRLVWYVFFIIIPSGVTSTPSELLAASSSSDLILFSRSWRTKHPSDQGA